MAFSPLPNGVKVAMEFTKDGQLIVNVYHITTTLPLISANLTAIANAFLTWWTTDLRTVQSSALVLSRIRALDVSVEDGAEGIVIPSSNQAGAIAGTDAPNNVALVVTHLTGRTGRSFKGRTYLAGVPSASVAGSTYNGAAVAAIATEFTDLPTRLAAVSGTHVVASYFNNGVKRPIAVASTVTAYRVNDIIDTQRRRVPGRGG